MIKNILFDFDGVILDSMPVREVGFRKIFEDHPVDLVDKLIEYHEINGGLSRFVKIRYFYEEILRKSITEDQIKILADRFSEIMRDELTDNKLLIDDCVNFIKNKYKLYNLHIVSGSEHNELNYLCSKLDLDSCFITIEGSPTPKKVLVENILKKYRYKTDETILIGDSINDYDAAVHNNINFYGYNNEDLRSCSYKYLDSVAI